ncbi:MAG TPA: bifunctional methylenetetrahydrofolate dehydrogenase/methenyltetrahydrofolate cyclohydrolase FolD [Spirochaetales bacterium]|nr:bifunctional methylenetetrahydrofolate dehydrogenase/methenyltetrahydrofolate cyclohydrolase FolD [Spirochaetales bacterium]
MGATVIDGKKVAEEIRGEIKAKAALLAKRGVVPGLGVILVGEDPASLSYVTAKEKACAENGLKSFERRLPASASEAELLAVVGEYNRDPAIHGILVQLPLPRHIDERKVIAAIAPEKDVDGFTPVNVGRMVLDEPCYLPCTPAGVIELIKRSGVRTDGARAVVVGRSNIVGKPLMNLLVRRSVNATVTVCHTGTRNLAEICREADILVACAGKAGLVTADMVKPGACVIDVGVNRVEDASAKNGYRLKGDVDYEGASAVAGSITPVPGGVGPMTITMLLANTVEAAARRLELSEAIA